MSYQTHEKFSQLFLPNSRYILLGLLAANLLVAGFLITRVEPVEPKIELAKISPEIHLVASEDATLAEGSAEKSHQPSQTTRRECRVWGPESDPGAFASLQQQLTENGSFPEVLETHVAGDPDYLVYVRGLGSRALAQRAAQELAAVDVESFLINRQNGSTIVSVGVFSTEIRAENQQNRVAGLGFEVEIEEMSRAQTVYNLIAHVAPHTDAYEASISACVTIAQG